MGFITMAPIDEVRTAPRDNIVSMPMGQFMPATPLLRSGPLSPNVVTFGQDNGGTPAPAGTDWGLVAKSLLINTIALVATAFIVTKVVKYAWK